MVLFSFVPFSDFHVVYPAVVNVKSYGCSYLVKSRDASCTWIDCQNIVFFVIYDFQNVGMSANEYVGHVCVDELEGFVVVSARIAADVHHENFFAFAGEILNIGNA